VQPVAVLLGSNTLSAGEDVAIAFRGRRYARSFGGTTGGATNSPGFYRLADGATVVFATYWDVDRTGHVYRSAIRPSVSVRANYANGHTQARAAVRWLQSRSRCKTSR
jgi:C-terminal processing protease CtpA/Prc